MSLTDHDDILCTAQFSKLNIIMVFFFFAVPGTCASIGYSNACCPPNEVCQASDGECYCNANCHTFGDCCQDVHCPSRKKKTDSSMNNSQLHSCIFFNKEPRTCSAIGITTCCEDVQNNGNCDVHFRDSQENHCSCNISCYLRNDCCSDVSAIGCICKQVFFSTKLI